MPLFLSAFLSASKPALKKPSTILNSPFANSPSTLATLNTNCSKPPVRLALVASAVMTLTTLSGCQTFKDLTGNDDAAVASASKTDAQYYSDAIAAIEKGHYLDAATGLTELRTFYPTGRYAEQALMDLMYAQFQSKEYETAIASAEQFIKLYPNNPQLDYAYYVRGVSTMQIGQSTLLSLAKLNQAHRDTGYMRLAFDHFKELLVRYPDSVYAPDAAQRMSHLYNQFAEHELEAARWYIKRDAPLAAVNRAKWVFQYYPLSEQVPESIAILATQYEQLGLTDLANQYKTLLQINYPQWLANDGSVRLQDRNGLGSSLLSAVSFGKLGRSSQTPPEPEVNATSYKGSYAGQTKPQIIARAMQLQLPDDDTASSVSGSTTTPAPAPQALPSMPSNNRGIRIGLGLPNSDIDQVSSNNSASQAALDSRDASMVNQPRRPDEQISPLPTIEPTATADGEDSVVIEDTVDDTLTEE